MSCKLHQKAACDYCARQSLYAQTERDTPVFSRANGFAPIGTVADIRSGRLRISGATRSRVIVGGGAK